MLIYLIFTIVFTAGGIIGQPILPSYAPRYQIVYLTPPYQLNQLHTPRLSQPVLQNRIIVSTSAETSDDNNNNNDDDDQHHHIQSSVEDEKIEVSQFHSEDGNGRIVFGFHSPDQMRMEARDIDGSVRGAYSYLSPDGNIVKMQYWDNGDGFHAAGNNIPVAVHSLPDFTPEVKEARDNHLRLYEAAVAALNAVNAKEDEAAKDESGYVDTSHYENGDEYEEDAPPEDGGVIIENPAPPSSVYADSISSEYPKVQLSQTNQLSDSAEYNNNNDELEEDRESVSIENPEFRQTLLRRRGKTDNPEVMQQNKKKYHEMSSDNSKTVSKFDNTKSKQASNGNVEQHSPIIPDPNRAFSYHYTHTIPKPVERVENIEMPTKHLTKLATVQAELHEPVQQFVAAVHDQQISPLQQFNSAASSFKLLPVYLPQTN